eukprot:448113_1
MKSKRLILCFCIVIAINTVIVMHIRKLLDDEQSIHLQSVQQYNELSSRYNQLHIAHDQLNQSLNKKPPKVNESFNYLKQLLFKYPSNKVLMDTFLIGNDEIESHLPLRLDYYRRSRVVYGDESRLRQLFIDKIKTHSLCMKG